MRSFTAFYATAKRNRTKDGCFLSVDWELRIFYENELSSQKYEDFLEITSIKMVYSKIGISKSKMQFLWEYCAMNGQNYRFANASPFIKGTEVLLQLPQCSTQAANEANT